MSEKICRWCDNFDDIRRFCKIKKKYVSREHRFCENFVEYKIGPVIDPRELPDYSESDDYDWD